MSIATTISPAQMQHVLDVARHLAVTADLGVLLRKIAEAATSLLGAERVSIFLHDPTDRKLWSRVALGAEEVIRVPDHAGIVGHVFQTNQPLNIPDAYQDGRFNQDVDHKLGFVTRNLLTAPMADLDRKPIGVIQAINKTGGLFLPEDEVLLRLLADQAGVAIQRYHLQRDAEQNVELRREMELAKRVQFAMLPENAPEVAGLRAAGWTLPASVTGGDLFDLWLMPGGQMGIFLGDASGHGVGPAMVVSQARTMLRALSEIQCCPRWLLGRVNARLYADLESNRFVTAFAGCLSPAGELRWWSAGHGPIFIRPREGEPFEVLQPMVPPAGVLEEWEEGPAEPVRLEKGGMLAVMSDGIFEARDSAGEFFGVERVQRMLDDCACQTPNAILDCFRSALREFQGQDEPADDQTLVVVQRTE